MDSLAGAYLSGLPQLFGTFGGFPLPLASPLMDGDEVEIRWQLATYGQNECTWPLGCLYSASFHQQANIILQTWASPKLALCTNFCAFDLLICSEGEQLVMIGIHYQDSDKIWWIWNCSHEGSFNMIWWIKDLLTWWDFLEYFRGHEVHEALGIEVRPMNWDGVLEVKN